MRDGTPKQKPFRRLYHRPKPLTICIAARCEVDTPMPRIVFCADRMVSAGLEFEHGEPKIQAITPACYVMISSDDSLTSDMIVKNVLAKAFGKQLTVVQVADLFREECTAVKLMKQERDVLIPLGLNYKILREESGHLSKELVATVTTALLTYDYAFTTQFLVFGVDPAPHIYIIDQNGDYKLQDYLGFGVIGNGAAMAFPEMTKYVWHRNVSLAEGIVRVYTAKKAAERMGAVGTATDLAVLHVFLAPDKTPTVGLWLATPEVIALLEDGIKATKKADTDTYVSIMTQINQQFSRPQTPPQGQGTTQAGAPGSGAGTTQT